MAHDILFACDDAVYIVSAGKPDPAVLPLGKLQEAHERGQSMVLAFAKAHKRKIG
jgi:hypothetical protein